MPEESNLYFGLSLIDWTVVAVYLVSVTAIGVWSYTKVKDISDYFMGGRRFGKIFMMFFAFGAGTSSEQAIGVVAGTWREGLAGIWWQFLWLWATPFYWIVAPVMRRMRALTTSDFFEARFSTSTATLYSICGIVMSIVFIAGGLFGSGKMVDALTGGELEVKANQLNLQVVPVVNLPKISLFSSEPASKSDEADDAKANADATAQGDPAATSAKPLITWRALQGYEMAILAMTVMFVLYGMAGGLGAAIITDFIQGVLTITFSFLLLPFVFGKLGGFGALHDQGDIKDGMLNLFNSAKVAELTGKEPIDVFYVFMLSLTALIGIVVQPHIMGDCGAGKTEF